LKQVTDWKLKFNDGTWRLVTAPPVLRGGILSSRMVRAYHRELLLAIAGRYIWPVTPAEERALFSEFSQYYRHLAEWAVPGLDPSDLTSESRHGFFIATESHPHPNPAKDEMVRGLSGVEQLLGYAYPEHDPQDDGGDEGAGDSDLNTIAISLLTFQHHDVLGMAHAMSSVDLAGMVGYANRKLKAAQQEAEDKDKPPAAPPEATEDPALLDDELFNEWKAVVGDRLAELGVTLPGPLQ
jgi:hypothetical protein